MSAGADAVPADAVPANAVPADLLRGDFHVHSTFSNDGHSTLAENLAAASAVRLRTIRLTEHVRVDTAWVPDFVAAVAAEPLPEGLEVLTGVEAKLLTRDGAIDIPSVLDGIDGVVLADHQFPGIDGPWSPDETKSRLAAGLALGDALDQFVDATIAAMRGFDHSARQLQLAHWFSILPKVGLDESQLTDAQLDRWASAAAETGTLVEVNEKWVCPGPRAVEFALRHGVRLVASTDAHRAEDVGRYDRVPEIIAEARAEQTA